MNRECFNMQRRSISAAVGVNFGFDGLTFDADKLDIFAGVSATQGYIAQTTRTQKQAPHNSHHSYLLPRNAASALPASWAASRVSAVVVVVVSSDDDSLLLGRRGRRGVHRRRRSIHRRRGSIHRLRGHHHRGHRHDRSHGGHWHHRGNWSHGHHRSTVHSQSMIMFSLIN